MKLIFPPSEKQVALGYHYTSQPLLTASEAALFNCLDRLAGGKCHIMCKPRLADIVRHHDGISALNKVTQKHVDFLLCRKSDWMPMLGVELDDLCQTEAKRAARDTFVNNLFAYVSIPLVRIDVREMGTAETLVEKLFMAWEKRTRILEKGQTAVPQSVVIARTSLLLKSAAA